MKIFKTALGASALVFSLTAWAQQPVQQQLDPADPHHGEAKAPTDKRRTDAPVAPVGKLSRADKEFIIDAAIGGLAEVEMGKLAQKNGVSREVKDFGEKLVTDHEKANRELALAVAPYAVMLPTRLDEEHQRHIEMLKSKKGADFDKVFATHMVGGHEKMVKLFTAQAKTGEAAPLKEFAAATLPTLEAHLKIARDLVKTKTSSR